SLPDLDITIIDSKVTSIQLGYVVMEAAKAAKEGKNKEEIIDMVNNIVEKIRILFLPKTLEYLRKGGRIGTAKSLLAVALKIQPILTVKEGEVAPYKNACLDFCVKSIDESIFNSLIYFLICSIFFFTFPLLESGFIINFVLKINTLITNGLYRDLSYNYL
ncbi:unnamed protein product, partial [marine sediment metagenome]